MGTSCCLFFNCCKLNKNICLVLFLPVYFRCGLWKRHRSLWSSIWRGFVYQQPRSSQKVCVFISIQSTYVSHGLVDSLLISAFLGTWCGYRCASRGGCATATEIKCLRQHRLKTQFMRYLRVSRISSVVHIVCLAVLELTSAQYLYAETSFSFS